MASPHMLIEDIEAYVCRRGERLREYLIMQSQYDENKKACNIISEANEVSISLKLPLDHL